MKFVEIYKLKSDGAQERLAICKLVGETAICEGEEAFVKNLKNEGIFDNAVSPPQKVFPKDGLRFLEQLQNVFKSGYLNASEVKEQ